MTNYLLESGADDSDSPVLHKLDCRHFDLGSLLGAGRLFSLGDFDSSSAALASARETHPEAMRCLECCRTDLVFPVQVWPGFYKEFAAA